MSDCRDSRKKSRPRLTALSPLRGDGDVRYAILSVDFSNPVLSDRTLILSRLSPTATVGIAITKKT